MAEQSAEQPSADQQETSRLESGLELWLSDNASTVMLWVLGTAAGIILLATVGYFAFFTASPLSIDYATLGQAGDFFGGLLNPLLSFLSVFALLVALVIQTRELRLSRESVRIANTELAMSRHAQVESAEALDLQHRAMRIQNFEQTFFAWLGRYSDLLASVEVMLTGENQGVERRGRRALRRWWVKYLSYDAACDSFRAGAREKFHYSFEEERWVAEFSGIPHEFRESFAMIALMHWEALYREWEYQLDSLFRTLYQLLQWIDSQSEAHLSVAQKWLYVSIVRGQLSWIELVYLFYNGHTERGKKFKALAERYALFNNLTFESDPVIEALKLQPPESFGGYKLSAFNSCEARMQLGLPETVEETLVKAAEFGRRGVTDAA